MRKKKFVGSIVGGLMISCLCAGCANDNVQPEAVLEDSEEISEEATESDGEEAVVEENADANDAAVEDADAESLENGEDNDGEQSGDIFLSESPDMEYWGHHRHVMERSPEWWESVKIGGGAAPIETSEGWLLFYHGVSSTCNGFVYSIGAAILDIDEPSRVKYRCENFILTPEEWYEERGFVPNVCFPCATLHDSETGRIAIYYGAADSYVALAFTRLDDIIDYIKEHSVVRESDTELGIR